MARRTSASSTPLDEVEGDPEVVAAARAVLEEGVHQLADTVRNSLNFYRMQQNAVAVDRAVLTGPAVDDRPASPTRSRPRSACRSRRAWSPSRASVSADASRLAVAAGLAVESV